jgi:hypothetical protein
VLSSFFRGRRLLGIRILAVSVVVNVSLMVFAPHVKHISFFVTLCGAIGAAIFMFGDERQSLK